MLLILLSVDFG